MADILHPVHSWGGVTLKLLWLSQYTHWLFISSFESVKMKCWHERDCIFEFRFTIQWSSVWKKEDLSVNKSTLNVSYVVQIHTRTCFHLFLKEYILKVLIDYVLCDYDVNSIQKNMTPWIYEELFQSLVQHFFSWVGFYLKFTLTSSVELNSNK